MCEHGNKFQELDRENLYAVALIEMGEGLKEISDIRVKLRYLNSEFKVVHSILVLILKILC